MGMEGDVCGDLWEYVGEEWKECDYDVCGVVMSMFGVVGIWEVGVVDMIVVCCDWMVRKVRSDRGDDVVWCM